VWSTTVLTPLVETIREQAETIGTLRAELAAVQASQAQQDAKPGVSGPKPTRGPSTPDEPVSSPWWRRWLWGTLRLTIATTGAGILLALPG